MPSGTQDGSELYYHQGTALMAVRVRLSPEFAVDAPQRLFEAPVAVDATGHAAYDVAPDGRFLMIQLKPSHRISVVVNWSESINKKE